MKIASKELEKELEKRVGENISDEVYDELNLIDEYGGKWKLGKSWNVYTVYERVFLGEPPEIGLPLVILVSGREARVSTGDESLAYLDFCLKAGK